jgi:outer membrane protein assembly factor BamB
MHISRDGKLLWKLNMTDGIVAVKSYQGQIYVSTLNNRLHSYNEEGVLKWYYETDGRAPTISAFDRHVLSGTTTGRVYYTYLPKREVGTSLMLSIAVVVIVGAAILLISRSWR